MAVMTGHGSDADHKQPSIADIARAWVIRFDRGLTPDEKDEFSVWQACDPRHRGAFLQSLATWQAMRSLLASGVTVPADADCHAEPSVIQFTISGLQQATVPTQPAAHVAARAVSRRRFMGWAATAAACAAGLAPYSGREFRSPPLQVPIGKARQFGWRAASVCVDACSAVLPSERSLRFIYGRAAFLMASNNLPIKVGAWQIVAPGADLMIEMFGPKVLLTFASGSAVIGGGGQAIRLTGPHDLAVDLDGHTRLHEMVRILSNDDVLRRFAWRQGRIVLDMDPLGEAIAEFNRHNAMRIDLASNDLAHRFIVGVFNLYDSVAFAQTVAQTLHVPIRKSRDGLVLG